jgi:nucleotide-binding universal stress UspA family protein
VNAAGPLRPHEAPAPGRSLDGFTLEEQVHAGGMGSIWRVTHAGESLPLLMKLPRLRDLDEPGPIVSFEVEQMIMPRLSGPHVPRFVAAGEAAGQPYLVMEQVCGPSLEVRLGRGPLPPGEVAAIGARVATALHDLHRQHVIHLDLAPGNVLFRESGEAVLIDFGLSRHDQLPDLMAEVITQPMGTDAYISPEQVLRVRTDPRSDIFSLGAILYELVTGELPFGGVSSQAGLKRRLYAEPDPPRTLNPACPDWLQEIILRCLEPDPAGRYGSAAQAAFALQHPGQVVLTARAARSERATVVSAVRRWLQYASSGPSAAWAVSRHLDAVPIIMVAVDLSPGEEQLAQELRLEAGRIFRSEPSARLTCVTVRKTSHVALDAAVDESGESLHMRSLAELKQWARPLQLPVEKLSFHVLESPDPAAALVDYARANEVEHIVIGARGSSSLRRLIGSVSAQVAAASPCTVTVVRCPAPEPPPAASAGAPAP